MDLCCGLVGLPNVGKSTTFNALTKNRADIANYPFCTIEPNVGIVNVPDERVDYLVHMFKSEKEVHAACKFVDIAGLVKGASTGEGLGNQFLSHIREANAICHIVRCFEDIHVTHVQGEIDPVSDIETINVELILADLQMLENSLPKLEKRAKLEKEVREDLEILKAIKEHLDAGKSARTFPLPEGKKYLYKLYPFITAKRVLYVANIAEEDVPQMTNPFVEKVKEYARKEGSEVITICAKLEDEISQLDETETNDFLESLGLKESGLSKLIKASYIMLDLISFLTAGPMEARAWTIQKGMTVQEAAGEIHSDLEKGFIKAEVISFEELKKYPSRVQAKEAGAIRLVGKDYIVQDGDVVLIHAN